MMEEVGQSDEERLDDDGVAVEGQPDLCMYI